MRPSNKTIYIQSNYSQNLTPPRQFAQQSNRNYRPLQDEQHNSRVEHKTEQRKAKRVSPYAVKQINDLIYSVIGMDSYEVQLNLRRSAKNIYGLINNQLLFNVKQIPNMKLLLYNTILMYIEQSSNSYQEKQRAKERQKSHSISSSRNITYLRQKDISLQSHQSSQDNQQLQNIKQTVPFIPKDKSKLIKNSQVQKLEQQLSNKIESTRLSLESILKKIQHYSNYKLNGQDIMRLKKSVSNVSQLKPSHFLNLNTPIQSPSLKQNVNTSRPQSRQSRNEPMRQQRSSLSRNNSKNKTYNGSFNNTRVQETSSGDQQNDLLIQHLQQIIQRKQNRIKQLTKQLSKNLSDQKQLQSTIENFQIEIQEIQNQRKNFQDTIEKLQEENLNYRLEIKQTRQAQIVRQEAHKIAQNHTEDLSQYNFLKEFQMRQKKLKLNIRALLQIKVQNRQNLNQQKQKEGNSLSQGSAFNDISQITPKRQSKNNLLPIDIDQDYGIENNTITTRKNVTSQKRNKQSSIDRSFNKFQIIGQKTQAKNKSNSSRDDLKQINRQNLDKILLLQALTIQQLLQSI